VVGIRHPGTQVRMMRAHFTHHTLLFCWPPLKEEGSNHSLVAQYPCIEKHSLKEGKVVVQLSCDKHVPAGLFEQVLRDLLPF
jgi:hypothetical protein